MVILAKRRPHQSGPTQQKPMPHFRQMTRKARSGPRVAADQLRVAADQLQVDAWHRVYSAARRKSPVSYEKPAASALTGSPNHLLSRKKRMNKPTALPGTRKAVNNKQPQRLPVDSNPPSPGTHHFKGKKAAPKTSDVVLETKGDEIHLSFGGLRRYRIRGMEKNHRRASN